MTLVNTNPQHPATTAASANSSGRQLQQSTSSPKFLHLDIDNDRMKSHLRVDNEDDSSPEEPSFRAEDFADEFDDDLQQPMKTNDNNGNWSLINQFNMSISNESRARLLITEYSATEESKNVRNFQCITLPDGKGVREIDMKVKLFL